MSWYYKNVGIKDGRTCYVATNVCEICGVEYTCDGPASSKYCATCAEKIRKEQNRERVRRFREKQKQRSAVDLVDPPILQPPLQFAIDPKDFDVQIGEFPEITLDPVEEVALDPIVK